MIYIKDEEFIRGNCPMTKEEVRILSISKLELNKESKVLDIGAGTGSISIQVAKICSLGKVIALEKEEEAINIIKKNKEKFNVSNLEIIQGEASKVTLDFKDKFDAIFIGGSGNNLKHIIEKYSIKLNIRGKMVLNFITIKNLYIAIETLEKLGYETSCTQVAISKTKGKSCMLMASNPIFIVEARNLGGFYEK